MKRKYLFSIICILVSIFFSLKCSLSQNSNAEKVGDHMITSKQAVIIALNDLQNSLGDLPDNFRIIVEQKNNIIEVCFVPDLELHEGGDYEITIDKSTGNIIKRIKGQ
jgi:hypothetical protein